MLKNFSIRCLSEADLPIVLSWRNHPEVRRFMFSQHEIEVNEHRDWFYKSKQDERCQLLMVEVAHNPIGYAQFKEVGDGGIADWGFYVNPNASKGSGTGVGITALNYAFNDLRLRKVCGEVLESNQRSISFHRKLGFVQEGFLRDHQLIDDVYHSLVCFGLLAHEWTRSRGILVRKKNVQN